MSLRKLLKWVLGLLVAIAVAILIVIWPVLGVNPFEGRIPQLWNLTSVEVDFFVRFPAARTLDLSVVRSLERDPMFDAIATLRAELEDLTEQVAEEVNPQIPLGALRIDVREDFFGQETAFAGRIQGDYGRPRLDNFLFMTRVAPYARFLSALKRGFVRDRIPGAGGRITVEKGLYLRVELPDEATRQLAQVRSIRGGRQHPENVVFVARIGDVVLVSDSERWIQHAFRRGRDVLPADSYFESDFLRRSHGGDTVEAYFRYNMMQALLAHHGAPGTDRPLAFLPVIVPVPIVGDITVQVLPKPGGRLDFLADNHPPKDGFDLVRAEQREYLQEIYDAEKLDLRFAMGNEGIGRFIPRERTVAAAVARTPKRALNQLLNAVVGPEERERLDREIRELSERRYRSWAELLEALSEGMDDMHLAIVHEPEIFERTNFATYRDPAGAEPIPDGQFSYTLVSKLRDSVSAREVVDRIKANLPSIGLEYVGPSENGFYERTRLPVRTFEEILIEPCFGMVERNGRHVFLSTSPEAAESVMSAARADGDRLVTLDEMADVIGRLPAQATIGVLTHGERIRNGLWNFVRDYATDRLRIPSALEEFVKEADAAGRRVSDDEIASFKQGYVLGEYATVRDEYEQSIAWLRAIGPIAFGLNLGLGSEKHIVLQGTVQVDTPEP